MKMRKTLATALIGGTLGLGLVAAPTIVASPGSPAVQSAEAVPYAMPAGTWGRTTYYVDRYAGCYNDRQLRYRKWHAMYWDGNRWYNAVRYDGHYWSQWNCSNA